MNDAGRIGFLIRGNYNNLETYEFLDVVYHNGSSYVAKKETSGNIPEKSNEYWQILAEGVSGETGGVTGVKGNSETQYRKGNVNITAEDIGVPEESYITGTLSTFPNPGSPKILYIDDETNIIYRWDSGASVYIPTGGTVGEEQVFFGAFSDFPTTGNSEMLYVDTSNTAVLVMYRWNGTTYVPSGGGAAEMGGSVIRGTATSEELYLKKIYAKKGDIVLAESTINIAGQFELSGIIEIGNITITATDGERIAQKDIEVKFYSLYEINLSFHELYGYRRTKADSNPQTRLVATDMAVGMGKTTLNASTGKLDLQGWANAWFVTGNKPVMMKYDGTIDYELNPDDYTKKADGTASDVANSGYSGNAMALFPTCWVKRWEDSTYEYFQVCNIQLTEDFKAYAHQRQDGSIMEWFARSIYDGANVSSRIRSISGLTPCNTVAGNTQISYAQANGSLWDCDTWSRVSLIWDLLRLMSLNDNVQEAYGYGYYTQDAQASGLKIAGTGDTKGQFYGKHANEVVKVFHTENFWGNLWKIMQGIVYNTTNKYAVKMYRPYNNSGNGYTPMSFGLTGTSGVYQSAHNMSEYGLLPIQASGSDNTYIPDGVWWSAETQRFGRFGAAYNHGFLVGCALGVNQELSHSGVTFGVSLTCEQPLAA